MFAYLWVQVIWQRFGPSIFSPVAKLLHMKNAQGIALGELVQLNQIITLNKYFFFSSVLKRAWVFGQTALVDRVWNKSVNCSNFCHGSPCHALIPSFFDSTRSLMLTLTRGLYSDAA